ncbi:unnamed protein product [Ixodes hexagonus]
MLSEPWELDPEPLIKTLQLNLWRRWVQVEDLHSCVSVQSRVLPLRRPRRVALRLLVPWTKRAVASREGAKALVVRGVHVFRLALIKLGNKMVEEGRLPDPKLVFQLELDELRRLLHTRSPALVLNHALAWPFSYRHRLYAKTEDSLRVKTRNAGGNKKKNRAYPALVFDGRGERTCLTCL